MATLKAQIHKSFWALVPAWAVHSVLGNQYKMLNHFIGEMKIKSSGPVQVEGHPDLLFGVVLEDGTKLVSGETSNNFSKMTVPARRVLGIDAPYSKVLVDYVYRYTFSHALVPVMTIGGAENERRGFHLQHENLPQESADFDDGTRAFLRDNFTPKAGWKILDIGCFLGHGALHLSRLIGPEGRLLAVEAMPENARIATFQLANNGRTQCEVLNRAIWHTADETIFINSTKRQANAIHSGVVMDGHKVELKTTSIKALTEQLGGPADLVSLTVNGAEVEALESLAGMAPEDYPKRMVMPGWYKLDGVPRSKMLQASLEGYDYSTLVTEHDFLIAWREDALG